MRVIDFISIKGGVGKSSSSIMTANCLAHGGYKVLVWDQDLNNSATSYYWPADVDDFNTDAHNVARALLSGDIISNIVSTPVPGVDIVQSSLQIVDLRAISYMKFKAQLEPIRELYDFLIIDCSPTYDNLVMSAMYAADLVVTPAFLTKFDIRTSVFLMEKLVAELPTIYEKWFILFNKVQNMSQFDWSVQDEYIKGFKQAIPEDRFLPCTFPQAAAVKKYTDQNRTLSVASKKDDGTAKIALAVNEFCRLITGDENFLVEAF